MLGMHDRLVQLERLVKLIANKPNASSNLNPNNLSQRAETPHLGTFIDGRSDRGSMRVGASELHYIGGDHWAAILDCIADLKDHFDREEQLRLATSPGEVQKLPADAGITKIHTSRHSLLLYGGYQLASQAEIIAALPPKGTVDRYISRYFNRQELVSGKCALLTKLSYDRQFV